jgi:tetratricopeptide (TPR) repeat protein
MQNVLGVAHIGNGQYERARDLLQEALSVSEATHGASSIEVAKAANNLSWAFIELGDHESAIPNAERALTIYTKILARESVEAAGAMTNLAAAKSTAGDKAGAQILHTEALSIRKQRLASDHPSIADSMMSLATVNSALGDFASVVELNQGAHTIYSQAYGRDHPMSVRAMNGVASGQFLTRQYAQAEIAFRELLDLSTRRLGDAHPELALYYNNLGRVLTELGKFHEAREHLQAGMDIVENGHPQRMLAISTQYNYATILMELGELTEASPRLVEATSQFIAVLGDKHPLIARSEVQLARLAWLMGDIEESEIAFKNSITALDKPGMSSAWLAEAKFELAKLYIQQGQASRAATLITTAQPVFESAYPEDSWRWAEFRAIAAVIASDTPLRTHSIEQLDLLLPDEAVRLQFIENLNF